MVKNSLIALALVLGFGAGAVAQQELFTMVPLDENNLEVDSLACAKTSGIGAVVYKLTPSADGVHYSAEVSGYACLVPAVQPKN